MGRFLVIFSHTFVTGTPLVAESIEEAKEKGNEASKSKGFANMLQSSIADKDGSLENMGGVVAVIDLETQKIHVAKAVDRMADYHKDLLQEIHSSLDDEGSLQQWMDAQDKLKNEQLNTREDRWNPLDPETWGKPE